MPLIKISFPTFKNVFDLVDEDVDQLEIKENHNKDKCFIKNKKVDDFYYNAFILDKNSKTKILCEVTFYPSSQTGRYLPRLIFKKVDLESNEREIALNKPIIIAFAKSEQSLRFWKLVGFLNSFKEIVDLGDFHRSFQVVTKDTYFIEFKDKNEKQKFEELKELWKLSGLKENAIRSLVFENRKDNIKAFYHLLKNKPYQNVNAMDRYKEKYGLNGDEAVWHHFLKKNDWILGLNVDIKFIREFYDEQKVGIENSLGKGSPQSDMIGISDYTTLIELKHANKKIFNINKTSKSRTNTWDFSQDFIEGISQCLGQKFSIEKSYDHKNFVNDANQRLDKNKYKTLDPKTIFIIGNRKTEFPHTQDNDSIIKSETFERFRRNNRNLEIITFDELFERAYHLVFSKKIVEDWYEKEIEFD